MIHKQLVPLSVLSLVLLGACQRPQFEEASVTIAIPSESQFKAMGKVASLSAVDYDRLCFSVNVKGSGIDSKPASTCNIERGLMKGSVAPGGSLEIGVTEGNDRVFEVYGFLRNSVSDPCPQVNTDNWGGSLNQVYYLGGQSGVSISPPSATVNIKISLPDASQNLIIQRGLASSCAAAANPPVVTGPMGLPFRTSLGAAQLSSANLRMKAQISYKNEELVLQGSNFKFTGGISQ